MDTIKIYSASELKESFPKGFERAYKSWQEDHASDIFWTDEIMDSLKATFKKCGVNLINWEISDSSPCFVKFTIPTYYSELADCDMLVDDYTGRRATNWIKTELGLKTTKRVKWSAKDENGRKISGIRYDITKTDGKDWSCEFTGVCYDHDFIESLLEDIHNGQTLSESFHGLADKAGKLFENEYRDQMTESYFIAHADANGFKYTESGIMI
jgi:hypothetical protein